MNKKFTMAERYKITKTIADKYFSLSKKEKGQKLNELITLTGFTRPYAVSKLKLIKNNSHIG